MGQIEEFNLSIDLQNKINNNTSLPISANDVTQTPDKVFVTPSEKAMISTNSNENTSQTIRIANLESTINNISSTDEKVAMNANGVAGYLSELIDNTTIVDNSGKLEAQTLVDLLASVSELNALQGITSNVQSQINNLSGVSVFRGVFASEADLNLAPNPESGQYAVVSDGVTSSYFYYYDSAWHFSNTTTGNADIDINTGTVGVLSKNRYEHQNAIETPFADPTGKINATNTNAAIVEVFRFADSLLKGFTQTVGSPLSQTDTLESNLRNFKIWYNDITEAITLKGVSTSPSNNGDEIIDKIKAIPNISITGIVKKKSKINMNAGDKLEIQLSSSISLVDITTTLIEFIPGATGVVVYNLEFDNGDSSNFENNDYIEFDGKMKLKNNFTVEAEKMVWTDIGNVSSFVINKSELQSIYSIDVKLRGDTID